MPVTATQLTSDASETDANSYATTSISPTADSLILAAVGSTLGTGGPNTPTASGASMTWVQVATVAISTTGRITVFRTLNSSPGSGAITFDFGGETQDRGLWTIAEFSGVVTTGSDGADAVVQSATDTATATSLTVTLSAFSNSGNATYGALFNNSATAITPGSGFSELSETQQSQTVQAEWKNTNDTTVDWSWSGSLDAGGIAIEISSPVNAAFLFNLAL